MDMDDGLEPVVPVVRKRKAPKDYLREKDKLVRHSREGKEPRVVCRHRNTHFCQAGKLTDQDVTFNFDTMYRCQTKVDQDKVILRLATVGSVTRKRVDDDDRLKTRDIRVTYHLLCHAPPHVKIPVCKATFRSVLGKIIFHSFI